MWRLFLDDISTACDAAGISSFPLPYPAPSSFTPPTHTPSMSPSSSWSLPRPTKLLYGISPAIVPREHFWPESVHLCGFWKLPCDWCGGMDDGRMVEFVESHCGRLAYTGFGSMEKYLNDVDWNKLLCTLNEGTHTDKCTFAVPGATPTDYHMADYFFHSVYSSQLILYCAVCGRWPNSKISAHFFIQYH